MIIKPKKIEVVDLEQTLSEDKDTSLTPQLVQIETVPLEKEDPLPNLLELNKSVKECIQLLDQDIVDVTQGWGEFTNREDVRKALNDLFIRLNTSPHTYTKHDYLLLLQLLSKTLLHLYAEDPANVITTEWTDPLRDDLVPSEKLVKEDINQEIETRQSEITRVEGLINDVNDLIPKEASSENQLADKEFVHNQVATNAANFRGDWLNWESVPTDVNDYPADYTGNKKPNNNDYLVIQDASDYSSSNEGIWRFYYQGDWDTLGKSGWQPQYQVEQAFTQEQLDSINSGITSSKVSTYDNYSNRIGTLESNKVDKVSTSNRIYGTNSYGTQTTYSAGDGISFTNGQIVNTRTSATWGNIAGDIDDQSDLQEVLDDFVTSEEVHSVDDIEIYVTSQIPIVDKTQDSSSSFSIDSNKMYMFGTRTSLTISFDAGLPGIVSEYMFQFTSGSTATTLVVPNTVVWLKDPDIQANKKYLVSIENNMGVIGEWENE